MYLVLDLETTSQTKYRRVANPFYNSILCSVLKYEKESDTVCHSQDFISGHWLDSVDIIIGHNIKFDLLFLWKDEHLQNFLKRGGRIWCTQLCEYILSAQQHKYPKLRDIAVNKYGCKYRNKNIEEGFNKGLDTSQMDINLLIEDARNDVLDTEKIALQQLKKCKEVGLYNLVKSQMDALLATTEMEFNGFKINRNILQHNKKQLTNELITEQQHLDSIIKKLWPINIEFNSASNDDLSYVFFGGKKTVTEKVKIGIFKTGTKAGQVKYKNVDVLYDIVGLGSRPLKEWKTKKEGIYSTNEAVLKQLDNDIAKKILKIRELNKEISTYYNATEEFIYDWDSCVHAELCHCGYEKGLNEFGGGTATGRLSSRNPNMQNQPRADSSKVKEHFVSRFEDGVLLDSDFKQLEVFVFAFLTQDSALIRDLNNKIDIYKVAASEIYGVLEQDVTDEQRQIVKRTILAITYGAGSFKISKTLDISVDLAENIIKVFYNKYPMTRLWQDNLVKQVQLTRRFIDDVTPKGEKKEMGYYQSFTGRYYQFFTQDSPDFMIKKGIKTSFNPPDIKNYPVQGTATADIVMLFLGKLWRKLLNNRDKCLLINTVHDSVVIDCKKEYVDFTCNLVQNEVNYLKQYIKELFKVDFNLNLSVDIKKGTNWGNVK